ncbi:hypothetical protein [Lachnotalea glycerini]|uniref:Uncharacterized protein n=1 Tax=Lachnotalea glycerini TaxID=1763509 RepID=A0A371JKC6_9FIRM|nr:hypothetical protein [Lachnotalea glycerini]RDY33183.1 hypothetical protein CG710_001260 [Lachnotalea glycerini]
MAWCPKCRNEYRKGIKVCMDCNVPLVESLEEYDKMLFENQLGIRQEVIIDELDHYETTENELDFNGILKQTPAYVRKEDKYKDTLSSAYTLLFVGFGGLIVLLLIITNIIDLHLASPGKYVTYSGMAILLLIFIIIGLASLKASKKLAKEAESENQLTNDILDWFNKNITKDLTDNGVNLDMVEEIQYFKRIDNIKEIVQKAYGELNEDYLDKLAEDIYQIKYK